MRSEAEKLLMDGAFLPAMPLVLDENRRFDEAGQRRLIRYYLHCGVDGIAVGVHSTQFAIRDPKINLFERVLSTAISEMKAWQERTGRTVLAVAGVCGETNQAVAEARLAAGLGYDAALLSPGGLAHLSEDDMVERTRAVAEVMDVIGFYLQPAVGGRIFSYDYWERVCAIPGVKAVKCAAFNRYFTVDVARAIAFADHEIALYTGNDDNIVADLLTRYAFEVKGEKRVVATRGGLLGHWAAWTGTAVKIFRAIKALPEGAPLSPEWLTLAAQITDVNSAFFDAAHQFAGCIVGIHEVLRRQGLMAGIWCLDPKETLSPGQKEEIDRVYRMYPELCDDALAADFLRQDRG